MDVLEEKGKKVVLLANEAIARGAIEAGVGLVSCYPGTPSSEVPTTLESVAKKVGFYFEYSSNEKVAFETAAGAAWSGVPALTAVKHFGLNVASDSVSPVAYSGVNAGYVIVVADDPNGWSSAQAEQDSRYYARMMRIPTIEPSNPQECLDYTKRAFEISKEFKIPVFLRTTTKVNHSIGTVELGEMKKPVTKGKFIKDPSRYNNIRPNLQKLHTEINEKLEAINKKYAKEFNKVFPGEGDTGIIVSGVDYEYSKEAFKLLGINPPILKVGLTHPYSHEMFSDFMKDKKQIIVLEELEPILENFVNQVNVNPDLIIHGKDKFPRVGEHNLEVLIPGLAELFKKKFSFDFKKHKEQTEKALKDLPARKPVMCPGCPHRSTFYAVKKVYGDDAVYAGDIGCYVLGIFEPFKMQDFIVSMGSGASIAHGITKVSDQEVVAFVGDSTFFHAGMPAMANLGFNDGKSPLIVVMDNAVTAMTGHQPHPGTGVTGMGEVVPPLKIDEVAKALGAEVRVVNSFSQAQLVKALEELKAMKGLRVLVSRGECRLYTKRKLRKEGKQFPLFEIVEPDNQGVGETTDNFSCPAIIEQREKKGDTPKYWINPEHCWGCSVCMQIAPPGAIKPAIRKKGDNE